MMLIIIAKTILFFTFSNLQTSSSGIFVDHIAETDENNLSKIMLCR